MRTYWYQRYHITLILCSTFASLYLPLRYKKIVKSFHLLCFRENFYVQEVDYNEEINENQFKYFKSDHYLTEYNDSESNKSFYWLNKFEAFISLPPYYIINFGKFHLLWNIWNASKFYVLQTMEIRRCLLFNHVLCL